jgi:glucokinase
VPGIVYDKTDTVWAPNIPGWENYPLKGRILEAVGDPRLRVKIDTDRTCYILGEKWRGVAKGCDNAIYLAVGTGIGAGILIDGRVLHGVQDIAGATGWMALQYPYTEEYIPVGCFEYYASGNGIATQARRALRCARNYDGLLSRKPIDEITSYDVFDGYEKGDHIAIKVLEKAIEMWGMGTSNLVSLFNPEKVIFGGGVFGPARQFIRRIYNEACKWGQPIAMRDVEYCASGVEGDAALLGAAYSVICTV